MHQVPCDPKCTQEAIDSAREMGKGNISGDVTLSQIHFCVAPCTYSTIVIASILPEHLYFEFTSI